jgi:hypothetical protein
MLNKNVPQNSKEAEYIKNIASEVDKRNQFVFQYLKPLLHNGLGTILRNTKSKGFSNFNILGFLALLPVLGVMTINSCYTGDLSTLMKVGKDTLYRFKNNGWIPWRKLLYSVSRRFVKLTKDLEEAEINKNDKKPTCLVFDDTDIAKTGVFMEGISKIYSHKEHRHILGFKLLVCNFFDGISSIPLDFSFHREDGSKKSEQYGLKSKDLKNQFTKERQKEQPSVQRKTELDEKKTTMVFNMINSVLKAGFKAKYVLTDSWFFSQELLNLVVKKGMDLISGVKMGNLTFNYNGKDYKLKALLNIFKSKAKYNRKLKIHYIELIVKYKGQKVKLFFICYHGQTKWRLIICSNTKLSFQQMLEIYQIRWSIEVFFKEMKQYLGLENCQSRDFDAHIAHTTLAMITYLALALKKRVDCHQTLGQLFREVKSELLELTIAQKVWKWFLTIITELIDLFDVEPKVVFQRFSEPNIYNRFTFVFQE